MKKIICSLILGLFFLSSLTSCLFFKPSDQSEDSTFSLLEESITTSSEMDFVDESAIVETSKTPEVNVLEGIFKGTEWGDYLHLEIEDDEGVIHSFFVLRLTEDSVDVQTLEEGQRIRIKWKTSIEFLDPPGENIEVDQVTFIALLQK